MSSNPKKIEVVVLPASHFIEMGVMYASSPLVRGNTDTPIAQQVVRNPDDSVYSVSYRHPYPEELSN